MLDPTMGVTVQYVGSLRTEKGVDGAIASVRSLAKAKSFKIFELSPEMVDRVRKEHERLDAFRSEIDSTTRLKFVALRKNPRVKGISLQVHPDIEEIIIAFVKYEDCWVLAGSVKIPFSVFEARADVLRVLEELTDNAMKLEAKEVWFDEDRNTRLEWVLHFNSDEYNADAAARGDNPYYPGLRAAPPGGYRYPNPTGVWKTEARAWLDLHPPKHSVITREDVESLYVAGAVNVDIAFDNDHVGLELTPPLDREVRKRLMDMIKSYREKHGGWNEVEERWASLAQDSPSADPWKVF